MIKKKINVLDCTIRDGGYYNNWKFKISEVNRYLSNCHKSGIKYVEIGFIFPNTQKKLGPFAYCRPKFLQKLKFPKKLKLCVMINASDYFENDKFLKDLLFNETLKKIHMIRIAVNFNSFQNAEKIVRNLKKTKVKIALNLMQSQNKSSLEIKKLCVEVKKWSNINYLYFADTFGSMSPKYVSFFCSNLNKYWKKSYGIHAHNNKSFALINTLVAMNSGATLLDSTILGMGRGAGNVSTESLLEELRNLSLAFNPSYLSLCLPYFNQLQLKYKWGPNLYYHYAANKNIHPTYIQKILTSDRYIKSGIFRILNNLLLQNASIYKNEVLQYSYYKNFKIKKIFNLKNFFDQKEILILGSGPSGEKYKNKIENFIKKKKPYVLSLNKNQFISSRFIDCYVQSYDLRIFSELDSLIKKKKMIITPHTFKKSNIISKKIIQYPIIIKSNKFEAKSDYCILDKPYAINYILIIMSLSKPKKINLACFDGYDNNEMENKYLRGIFRRFSKKTSIDLKFLTKSRFQDYML